MNTKGFSRGFTLIESLVGAAIFIVLALSAYKAFGVLMDAVGASQAKIAAASVANEKTEIIRNLPYTDVGIVGGLPVGKIQRNQTIVRDNYSFNVQTTIRSVDDPFDGTIGGTPSDTSPADYKLVDIDITCPLCKIFTPMSFTTLVAPHALETSSTNGALFIRVFDSSGIAVPNASLHIVNSQTTPTTTIDETTDNTGWVKIVDAPVGTNAYNLIATKTGYTTDKTYTPGGAAGASPVNPDPTVVLQQVSQANLTIDKISTVNVSTIDSSNCSLLPAIGFSLTGTKLIGTPAVLKYPAQSLTTDATGNYSMQNMEWDTYSALLTSASYDLAGTTPLPTFTLNPNETKNLQLVVAPHVNRALLVSVKDSSGNAIDGVTVRLKKNPFDQTKTTNSGACPTPGQVFWNGLASGTYSLTVSKTGYTTYTNNSLSISANWQSQIITLN